jgi:plastocyanin
MRRFPLLVLICALAAFGLAACGDDNKSSSDTTQPAATDTTTTDTTTTEKAAGGGKTIKVSTDPSGALQFVQKSLTAPAGTDTFEFENPSSTPHDFVIEEGGKEIAKTDVITKSKATVKAKLDAGEKYTYFCSVPGHRQAGMEGNLTVK